MSAFSFAIALVCSIAGLLIIAICIKVVFHALFGDWRNWSAKSSLHRHERVTDQLDSIIDAENWEEAARVLKKGFFLDDVRFDSDLIESASNLNLSLLSRTVLISQRVGSRIENLAIVEDLLLTRRDLMRSYLEAHSTKSVLEKKRERQTPTWALSEYATKLSQLSEQIATNRKSLESQLEKVFQALLDPRDPAEITFH